MPSLKGSGELVPRAGGDYQTARTEPRPTYNVNQPGNLEWADPERGLTILAPGSRSPPRSSTIPTQNPIETESFSTSVGQPPRHATLPVGLRASITGTIGSLTGIGSVAGGVLDFDNIECSLGIDARHIAQLGDRCIAPLPVVGSPSHTEIRTDPPRSFVRDHRGCTWQIESVPDNGDDVRLGRLGITQRDRHRHGHRGGCSLHGRC